jgi:hypothetical protein
MAFQRDFSHGRANEWNPAKLSDQALHVVLTATLHCGHSQSSKIAILLVH